MLRKYASIGGITPIKTQEDLDDFLGTVASVRQGNQKKIVRYSPDFAYARFKAIGCIEVDGPNANADAFPYAEFLDARPNYGYQSFIGKHAYIEHASDNINNSIGDLYHSHLNRFNLSKFANKEWAELTTNDRGWVLANRRPHEDGSIEVLMAVDRKLAPKIARMLDADSPVGCSMGTNIDYSECTICGNRAYVEANYCPHIKHSKGRTVLVPASQIHSLVAKGSIHPEWLPWILSRSEDVQSVKKNSKRMVQAKAFEINYGLSFFELSVVSNPAFTRGYKLEKIASISKPSAQLMPIVQIGGKPVELILKVSDGYLGDVTSPQSSLQPELLQRSGEVAKNALATGNVEEVLVDQVNAPLLVSAGLNLIDSSTPGFYQVVSPDELLSQTFSNVRHRSKMGVVGTVEEHSYCCAHCKSVFDRKSDQKHASATLSQFSVFSLCPTCEVVGLEKGASVPEFSKHAEYPTLPSTAEFTGDKEVFPGKGAFVGEKEDLYEGWAQNGSKQIEAEKEYRPMGTIFIDPITAKNDLNHRASRIDELTKSAQILHARTKKALGDPLGFLSEMKSSPIAPPSGGDPLGGGLSPLPGTGAPAGIGMSLEVGMEPESLQSTLENTKADLQMVLDDLTKAKQMTSQRETEATKALQGQLRWGRRFIEAAVKTAESVDTYLVDAESAITDALEKLEQACSIIESGEESKSSPESKSPKPPSSEKKKEEGESKSKPSAEGPSSSDKSKGDDAMAKESSESLTINAAQIELLGKFQRTLAPTAAMPFEKKDDEDKDEKKKDDDEKGKKKENPFAKKEAASMPPTGAKDPGDYGNAGAIEAHELKRVWTDMKGEFDKMLSAEKAKSLNDPDTKIELLTGFLGNKTPDDPEVGKQKAAPAIYAKRFLKSGPKFAQSFIGVIKIAEDGSAEAFTANFSDVAGTNQTPEAFDTFSSPEYLDTVVESVKTLGVEATRKEMFGKTAQMEGVTPGKTEKVNPLYDTKEEQKKSNQGRDGMEPSEGDGHASASGDTGYYAKAYGDSGYAAQLTSANQKIASLESQVEKLETEKRAKAISERALHLARVAASRGVIQFDFPSIQAQAAEYLEFNDAAIMSIKSHLERLPIVNARALEAYQIPQAEKMQNGVIYNSLNTVDKMKTDNTSPENVAPEGIQPSVESDAKLAAQQDRIRKAAAAASPGVVPQMQIASGTGETSGVPDVSKFMTSTLENRLKRAGVWEENKHLLPNNRRRG